MDGVQIRPTTEDDIGELLRLHREVYPPEKFPPAARWKEERLRMHLEIFPHGQLVAELEGRVVGSAATHIVHAADALRPHRWVEVCAGGNLDNHDPTGDCLYGVDICVSPHSRRRGVGSALYKARFALLNRFDLDCFVAGARIPGYRHYRDELSPEDYLEQVVAGEIYDPTLSFQLKKGFRAVCVLPSYLPDPETSDNAVLIVKENESRRSQQPWEPEDRDTSAMDGAA
jgi:GNAT superfamily N-acetyltransferase